MVLSSLNTNSCVLQHFIRFKFKWFLGYVEISAYFDGEAILNSDANNNINFHCVNKVVNSPQNNNSSLINKVKP